MKDMDQELFGDSLYIHAPLSWSGYEIERMYEGMGDRKNWMASALQDVVRTLRLPREDLKVAAIWFCLQRKNKEAALPKLWAEPDRNEPSEAHRFWTLFYFAYIDYLRFDLGSYFKTHHFADRLKNESVRFAVATNVVRQLIGYRGCHSFLSRVGDLDVYDNIAGHAKQEFWINDMPDTCEALLALAFQANGWAAFRSRANADNGTVFADSPQAVLAKVVKEGLSCDIKYAVDEYERRALFFMLAQRLFVRKDLKMKFSRERALFAVLYLDFYRRPFGDAFVRKSFRSKWESMPFEKKEDFAAKCRKFLVEIRNEAAQKWQNVD